MSRSYRRSLGVAGGCLILALMASAGGAELPVRKVSPEFAAKTLKNWNHQLLEVDEFLHLGKGQKAYKSVGRLLRRMTDQFVSGPDVDRFLGMATLLKAVAAYQIGRQDEALWHWQVAVQLFPQVAEYQLLEYGEAGSLLKSQPLPKAHPSSVQRFVEQAGASSTSEMQPPRSIFKPRPHLPAAKRGSGRLSVVVNAIIDRDGEVREPIIIDAGGELTLVYATLDAMRRWRFKPASIDGEPVETIYRLEMNYDSDK